MEAWSCITDDPTAQVTGYTIQGLGHSWPNTVGLDNGVAGFNATQDVILPFFTRHAL